MWFENQSSEKSYASAVCIAISRTVGSPKRQACS
jgi:hypothetical protein